MRMLDNRKEEICVLNEESTKESRANARAKAMELVEAHIRRKREIKAHFTAFAQRHGIEIKKSWSTNRILEAIAAKPEIWEKMFNLQTIKSKNDHDTDRPVSLER